ncbi:homoserine kinase [Fusobacterium sp. PH5-44]|uniref:homoserine kinase n=1 Tax=unclassified Fusobacterium TaxID=2648384 RepID=UPI003D237BF2
MIKIRVPGTSANLGPGFDTLGLAISLYSTFYFEERDSGLVIEGCDDKYANKENLVYRSFEKTLSILGKKIKGLYIKIDAKVPVSRGLGSSSSCIVAGVAGAYVMTNTPVDLNEIFTIATEIEGHPDNVAPAIFGGLVSSLTVENKAYYVKYNIDDRFNFLALIPDFETSTSDARKVLPKTLTFEDTVYTMGRLGIILKAFENYDKKLLNIAMDDKIHEPYRKKIIHEYEEVKEICKEIDSICFFISGSGSTLMNILNNVNNFDKIKERLTKLKYNWKGMLLTIDNDGLMIY